METGAVFEATTDWLVAAVMLVNLAVLYGGWLASYRAPKADVVGDSLWFRLPAWAQIAGGLAVSAAGAAACLAFWRPIPLDLSPAVALLLRIGGLALLLGSSVLFLWARRTLGVYYNPSTSTAVQLNAEHRLIQHGPFTIVRHPIYLSLGLMLISLLMIYRTWTLLLILIMMSAALDRRARTEDRALEGAFGAEWRAYASRVPMFVPRFRARRRTGGSGAG